MNRRKSKGIYAGFCLILIAILSACGASTSDSTSVAGSVVLTPTIAPTATNTPVPTATPIPDVLESLPLEISDDDVSVIGGGSQYQITEVIGLKKIGGSTASTNRTFLVMRGFIYNYSNANREFHDVDFQIDYAGARNVNPNVNLMASLARTVYKGAHYPDCNIFGCLNFILPPKRAREMILVYHVPESIDYLTLNFAPGGTSSRSRLGLVLFPTGEAVDDRTEYLALKESVNGQPVYTLSYNNADPASAEVSEIVDTENMTVDNCFGTQTITREIEISQSVASRFETLDEMRGSVMGIGPIPFLNGLFEVYARRVHEKVEEQELTVTRREEVTAAPGTRTKWRLDVYKVSFSGLMIFTVGSRRFEAPYKLTDKLRTELVSEPTEPCPGLTPTLTP